MRKRRRTGCSSAIDMEVHVKEQHGLKELLSCNQCDFDTESRIELQDHMAKNIHDINIKNKTIPAATKCHKCEYETNDPNSMDSHVVSLHCFVQCDKCEYIAEDNDIMKKHKMKHTGSSLFICGTCEFEATRRILLETHIEAKHTDKPLGRSENNTDGYFCVKCEKNFKTTFVKKYHHCVQETKYACPICEFLAVTLGELETHMLKCHLKPKLKCEDCHHETNNHDELNIHIQVAHKTLKVEIQIKDQVKMHCDQCEYKCRLNIQLKKHKQTNHKKIQLKYNCDICEKVFADAKAVGDHNDAAHGQPEQSEPFPCEVCGLFFVHFNLLKEHSEAYHSTPVSVPCQQCGKTFINKETLQSHMIEDHKEAVIFHTMAKQVDDLTDKFEDFESLKEEMNSIKEVFKESLELVTNNFADIIEDMKSRNEKYHEETTKALSNIYNKMQNVTSKQPTSKSPSAGPGPAPHGPTGPAGPTF